MIGYVYLTENLKNSKKYIGSHHATALDTSYIGSGTLLLKAIEKYGKENFQVSIIEECETEEQLVEREEFWIRYYNAVEDDEYYNLTYSGYTRGITGYKHTEENKRKCARFGPDNGFYGKGLFGKDNGFYGKHHSDETRKLMRENHADFSGENHPNYGKRGPESPNFGKKRTPEQCQHISDGQKGKRLTPEHIEKIRNARKGVKQSEEQKLKHSISNKELGIKPPSQKGKIFVTNDTECHLIDPSEYDRYVDMGFRRGKLQKDIALWKDAGHRVVPNKGKFVVHHPDELKDKYITEDELESYLSRGYVRGGKPRNKNK